MPKFGWKAVYEDGVIKQYPVDQPETNFRVVREKGMPYHFFVGTQYGVNLKTGELLIHGHWQRVGNLDAVPITPTRLVYFRRHFKMANGGGAALFHFFGYEHAEGEVRVCVPDTGEPPTICYGEISHHE